MKRLIRAAVNTWKGLIAASKSEAAFRQEIMLLVLAVPLALLITSSSWKRLALVSVVFLSLIVELLYTAIEKLADRVTLEHDEQIGRVKDMGSAAVGLALVAIFVVWSLVLAEFIMESIIRSP